MKQFQKRWCVVHESILYYFDKKKTKQQLGAIILKGKPSMLIG